MIQQKLESILKKHNYPISEQLYAGSKENYFIWTFIGSVPSLYGDNKALEQEIELYLILYKPFFESSIIEQLEVLEELRQGGFKVAGYTCQDNEKEQISKTIYKLSIRVSKLLKEE